MFKHAKWIFGLMVPSLVMSFPMVSNAATQTITFSHWYSGALKSYLDNAIREFEKENPGVKVKSMSANWGEYQDKVLTSAAAGKPYDVIMASSYFLASFSGILTDVNSLIKASDFNKLVSYDPMWNGCTYKGKILAVPFGGGVQRATFWNKDLFARYGLDPEAPPLTWDRYLAVAKRLTIDTNGDGKPNIWGADSGIVHSNYENLLISAGGVLVRNDTAQLNSPASVKTLEFLSDLNKFGVIGGNFTSQTSAMSSWGPFTRGDYLKCKFNWGLTQHPTPSRDNISLSAGSDALGVGKVPNAKRQAAWKFIRFLMSSKMQARFTIETGFPAMNSEALKTREYRSAVESDPRISASNDMMKYAQSFAPQPWDKELWRVVNPIIDLVTSLKTDPRKAADDMQREANRIISRYKKK